MENRLMAEGKTPVVLLGFGNAQEVFYAREFAALGCEVVSLKRICMGDLPLDEKLVPGECKYLSDEEISKIKNMQKL